MPTQLTAQRLPTEKRYDGNDRIFSPQEVQDLVIQGQTIVIYQDSILRLDSWLDRHPGGRLAILHMVGKDATDEIVAYHPDKTLQTMAFFQIGLKAKGSWIDMTPLDRGAPRCQLPHEQPTAVHVLDTSNPPQLIRSRYLSLQEDDVNNSEINGPNQQVLKNSLNLVTRTEPVALIRSNRVNNDSSPTSLHASSLDISKTISFNSPTKSVIPGTEKSLQHYPPLDVDVQQDIAHRYRQLHQTIMVEGLYECSYTEYMKELARYITLFILFLISLHHEYYITSAVFLGLFWHQIMFTAHDAGHCAITHSFIIDTLLGIFIADFCCGLSIGWWKSSHNIHHLMTNEPEHDPDIQNLPLFAICPSFFKSLASSYYEGFVFTWDAASKFFVPYQKYTYYPIMAIARFNLYVLSWLHILSSKSSNLSSTKAWWIRPTEIAGMACYWFIYGYCLVWCSIPVWRDRILFVFVSHIVLMPLHVQINLSHWGMSTSSRGMTESFAQSQMRTTMDVNCPAWLDFAHGGLQFQVVHHLFPRIPRHNLRRAQFHVKQFSADTGIPYSILGFIDGNRKLLSRLGEVSEQLRILASCQKSMIQARELELQGCECQAQP